MQALKIEIAAIHHVEGAGLSQQLIEHVDMAQFAVAPALTVQVELGFGSSP